ncbi:hypothetical protein B0H19DRAFT_1253372 [Mycena capillaripes]|nr:hypothetical protein B0H19DRAFT_1253372 [Mycena capillaripes]
MSIQSISARLLASAILSFVTHRKLRTLFIAGVESIPEEVVLNLISSTPRLHFYYTLGCDGQRVDRFSVDLENTPSIDRLILYWTSAEHVCGLLSRPQSTALIVHLTGLSIPYELSVQFITHVRADLEIYPP